MKTRILFPLSLAVLLVIAGCSKQDPPVGPVSTGQIDATVYVALGNSITAGGQSGAMYASAQEYSLGNLIAEALGTPFVQPLFTDPGFGNRIEITSMNPVTLKTTLYTNPPGNLTHPTPYNNLGVYGCVMVQALDTSDITKRSNPYFQMVMRDQRLGKSLLQQALALHPTFMSFFLGANDALIYGLNGGTAGTNMGLGGVPPLTLPTEPQVLQGALKTCFDVIKSTLPNTKVITANIPSIKHLPYFTTVPIKIPNPGNPSQLLSIYFVDKSGQTRAAEAGDYILLGAQAKLAKGQGLLPTAPLPSSDVLDKDEAAILDKAITDFNTAIKTEADAHGYPMVDLFALFQRIKEQGGYPVGGETFTVDYIKGGLFSLDGIHPSSKGSAIVAAEFIRVMNATWGANLPYPNVGLIPGIPVPLGKGSLRWSGDWTIPETLLSDLKALRP